MAPRRIELPNHLTVWDSLVRERNLNRHTLESLPLTRGGKRFSGSDIPDNAFLQLRALWPDAIKDEHIGDIFKSASFYSQRDFDAATKLLDPERPRQGLAIVHRLLARLDKEDPKAPTTPDQPPGGKKLMWLASQWHAMSQVIRNINELPPKEADDHPSSSPKVIFGDQLALNYGKVRALDFARPPPQRTPSPDSPAESGDEELGDDVLDFMDLDTPSKIPASLRADVDEREEPSAQDSNTPAIDAAPHPPARPPPEPRDRSLGRTPYEVQTSSFFDKFVSGFIDHVFPHPCGLCLKLEERRYIFGGKLPSLGQAAEPPFFNASPDGVFFRRDAGVETVFALVELKPFRRKAQERLIGMEETAEMVAYLYEAGAQRQVHHFASRDDPTLWHQLIISFDRDEFWFVVVGFRREYLDYIQNPHGQTIPVEPALTMNDMITFQRIGPFELRVAGDMMIFLHVFLAILLAQVKIPYGGADIYQQLLAVES